MKKINKFQLLSVFTLLLVVAYSYRRVFEGFFQHDEWIAFGDILSRKTDFFSVLSGFFIPDREHFVPVFQTIFYTYIKLFKYNFAVYAFLSILLELIIVFLVYVCSLKVFKRKSLALISATFFGLSSSVYQSTSWVLYDVSYHYSMVFSLISLIYFWDFLEKEKIKKLRLSVLFLVISLFTKEVAAGYFVLFPITFALYKGWNLKKEIKYFGPVLAIGLIYLAIRVSMYFIPTAHETNPTVFNMQTPANILLNLTLYPSKSLWQTIFPQRFSLIFSKWITYLFSRDLTGLPGTTQFDVFTEQKVLQVVSFSLFLVVLIGVYRFWQHRKNQVNAKDVLFGLLFIIINSFIYAFASGKRGLISLADPRNIYLQSVGTAIFLVSLAARFSKKSLLKVGLLILPLILIHTFYLRQEMANVAAVGTVRKNILYQIKRDYPDLPSKVVFYTESDTTYYGMPEIEKMLPFELGLGQTLMSWYQLEEKYPRSLFDNRSLWHPIAEGYIDGGDRGFGYFRKLDSMLKVIKDKKLDPDSIIAYRFYSSSGLLLNITDEVRDKVKKRWLKY